MGHKAIGTEIAVIGQFPEITAILCRTVFQEGMIRPLPDTTANQFWELVDYIPVIFYISRAVTHGMAVFAKEKRERSGFIFGIPFQERNIRIHPGIHICSAIALRILRSPAETGSGGILTVDQSPLIFFSQPLDHFIVILAVTAFVSGGPGENTWMIFIPLMRSRYAPFH